MSRRVVRVWVTLAILVLLIILVGYPTVKNLNTKTTGQAATPKMVYGYAAPTVAAPGSVQISEHNSFIGHGNTVELYNSTDEVVDAELNVLNFDGSLLFDMKVTLPPHGSRRIPLQVDPDKYGTIIINGNGVVFRNYVGSKNEYVLPFPGQ